MLEELERAGTKSRKGMHEQIEKGFASVAEAINDLGIELQGLSTHKCTVDDVPCPKADVPWVKQGVIWLAAASVGFGSFVVVWMLQHGPVK